MWITAREIGSVRAVLGWLSRRQAWHSLESKTERPRTPVARIDRRNPIRERQVPRASEPPATVQGVIRREEIPLLARYGTSYGLFDEQTAGYDCVLKSDTYRLGEYVGDHVEVAGTLTGGVEGMPVMDVTSLELLEMKWMR